MEDDAGNVVLSMKRADREKYWIDLEKKFETGEPVAIKITDANKGGLMTELGGIQGFLPVSQLSPANYPRVTGGDKDEILTRLRRFIGQEVNVKVINCDKEGNKLIFSEKAVRATEVKAKIDKYHVGDKVTGRITGIVDFGLFISVDPQIEGLVHISEVSWSRVTDLNKIFKVGDEVETMIISVDDGKISLSIKRLLPDPWVKAASKYKVGDVVRGEVTKITPFGAFVSLDEEIDGLVHISELSSDHVLDPGSIVELGKEYQFKIISIEPDSHRLGLSLKVEDKKAKKEVLPEDAAKQKAGKKEEVAEEEKVETPKKVKKVKKDKEIK
jgi:small subunit ribosomal protein S1